jgi:hypothetical protein
MSGYTRWQDIRAEYVGRAGGEEAVAAGSAPLSSGTASPGVKRASVKIPSWNS